MIDAGANARQTCAEARHCLVGFGLAFLRGHINIVALVIRRCKVGQLRSDLGQRPSLMNLHLVKDKSNAMLTWRAGRTDVLEYLQLDIPCNLGFDRLRNAERWRFFGFACLHLTVNVDSRRWRRGNIAPARVFRQTGSRIDSCELRQCFLA